MTNLIFAEIPRQELNISLTLTSGQAFRWKQISPGEWLGAIENHAIHLVEEEKGFWWQTYPYSGQWEALRRYFQLDININRLYPLWSDIEPRILPAIERFRGLRIIRQNVIETLFSFLCACCNNVPKISRSVYALARRYGSPIACIDGEWVYKFPEAHQLAHSKEHELREDLWGFRAPRVIALAEKLANIQQNWIYDLSSATYSDAHHILQKEYGIGAKIADCVCLFGLGHSQAVPVDTHIYHTAQQWYMPELTGKSLTTLRYRQISSIFQDVFGSYAGWAQQYIFMNEINGAK
jgi:N-glycosylase/DNA lyase